jgi:hypothetical protein
VKTIDKNKLICYNKAKLRDRNEKIKKETKVYYILNSDFNKTLKEKEENE